MSRLYEYVQTELFPDMSAEIEYGSIKYQRSTINKIKEQCSQIIKEYNRADMVLFRGSGSSSLIKMDNTNYVFKAYPRDDRWPKDTQEYLHDLLNDAFYKKFKWKPRSQGVFASHYSVALGYGVPYVFFPVNGYKYVWSMRVDDLYGDYIERHQYDYEEYDVRTLGGNWVNTENPKQKMRYLGYYEDGGFRYKRHKIITDKKDKYEALVVVKHRLTDEVKEIIFEFVPDLTKKEWEQEAEDKTMKIINTYQEDDLDVAMRSTSKEIMFKCDMYYLMKMPTDRADQSPKVYDLGLTRWI